MSGTLRSRTPVSAPRAPSPLSPSRSSAEDVLVHAAPAPRSNMVVRTVVGLVMLSSFIIFCATTRQMGVVAAIFVLQTVIYRELVNVKTSSSGSSHAPAATGTASTACGVDAMSLIFLPWYWFCVIAFYMYARTLQPYLVSALEPEVGEGASGSSFVLRAVVNRHVPVSFGLYCVGLIFFVVSLRRRRNFRAQFAQLAYCHVALLTVVGQSTLFAANAFSGLFWCLMPMGLVIANDTFAYFAGVAFGKTPLIRLSPKKTVEGFIGGAICTIIFALFFPDLMSSIETLGWRYLWVCPVESGMGLTARPCDINSAAGGLFKSFPLSSRAGIIGSVARSIGAGQLSLSPAALHSVVMGLFASTIAPFGGFLASGFKRAFKIKDFSSILPGHGGFTDRLDCQLLMGAFAYVYLHHLLKLGENGIAGPVGVEHHFEEIIGSLRAEDIRSLIDKLQRHVGL